MGNPRHETVSCLTFEFGLWYKFSHEILSIDESLRWNKIDQFVFFYETEIRVILVLRF